MWIRAPATRRPFFWCSPFNLETSVGYVNAVIAYCETLEAFPLRGAQRDDIRPGLRITNYKWRTVIAFTVNAGQVSILGVFYGGQDYETDLQDDLAEDG